MTPAKVSALAFNGFSGLVNGCVRPQRSAVQSVARCDASAGSCRSPGSLPREISEHIRQRERSVFQVLDNGTGDHDLPECSRAGFAGPA